MIRFFVWFAIANIFFFNYAYALIKFDVKYIWKPGSDWPEAAQGVQAGEEQCSGHAGQVINVSGGHSVYLLGVCHPLPV